MSAPEWFIRDLSKFNKALEPYALEYDDGERFIGPDAPEELMRPYSQLVSFGYANGWL